MPNESTCKNALCNTWGILTAQGYCVACRHAIRMGIATGVTLTAIGAGILFMLYLAWPLLFGILYLASLNF